MPGTARGREFEFYSASNGKPLRGLKLRYLICILRDYLVVVVENDFE